MMILTQNVWDFIIVTWHHKMSGKSHSLVLRYRHFYTAKNKGNKKILTNIIKCIFILENCNPDIFGIILKLIAIKRMIFIN